MTGENPLYCRGSSFLLLSRAAEAAGAAVGFGELSDLRQGDLGELADHHLRDAIARTDGEVVAAEVEEDHLDFAAVVRVHRAGRVRYRDMVLGCPAAAGANLRLISGRQFNGEPGGDDRPGERFDLDIRAGAQIVARIVAVRFDRQESFTAGHEFDFYFRHGFLHFALSSLIRFCSKYTIRRLRSQGANDPPS